MPHDLPLKLVPIVRITVWPAVESLTKSSRSVRAAAVLRVLPTTKKCDTE